MEFRMRIKSVKVESFIQTDDLRNMFDSFKMLESAKSKEYMDRLEAVKLL